jgi:hypothetical protein
LAIEQLTYVDMAERLNISAEAARALARRMQLPRQKADDRRTRVAVDFSEIQHKPSPLVRRAATDALRTQVAELKELVTKAEAMAARQRDDYECERICAEWLTAKIVRMFADLVAATEKAVRLECELTALQARPWWLRLLNHKPCYAAEEALEVH